MNDQKKLKKQLIEELQELRQKVAELQCEAQELQKKAMSGDTSLMTDAQELISKASALTQELQGKYSSIEDRQEFQSALAKAMSDCN